MRPIEVINQEIRQSKARLIKEETRLKLLMSERRDVLEFLNSEVI